jgi:hypothetical protein
VVIEDKKEVDALKAGRDSTPECNEDYYATESHRRCTKCRTALREAKRWAVKGSEEEKRKHDWRWWLQVSKTII